MKKLLIVVDYQNDFVSGALGFPGAEKLDELIYTRILEYKHNNDDVIYTFDTHDNNYLKTEEGKNLPIEHCIKGSKGHDLYGKVNTTFNKEIDIYFEKPGFPSLEMANYLKNKDYLQVELCGLVSNICVISNAVMVKAALPNAHIIVDSSLTSSFDSNMNKEALDVMKGLHVEVR